VPDAATSKLASIRESGDVGVLAARTRGAAGANAHLVERDLEVLIDR
jgi:hypothetical protein